MFFLKNTKDKRTTILTEDVYVNSDGKVCAGKDAAFLLGRLGQKVSTEALEKAGYKAQEKPENKALEAPTNKSLKPKIVKATAKLKGVKKKWL